MMQFILSVFSAYSLTFLIASSAIFDKPRHWIILRTPYLTARGRHMLECRMCSGFWVSILVSLMFADIQQVLAIYGASYFLATQERG